MADIRTATKNITAIVGSLPSELAGLIHEHANDVESYIREQLWSGLDGQEKELRPTYLTDPYFKQRYGEGWRLMAEKYADWKMDITPPSSGRLGFRPRARVVPNLFIDGTYHRSIMADKIDNGVSIGATASFAGEIEQKYGEYIYQVGRTARKKFIDDYVRAFLASKLRRK